MDGRDDAGRDDVLIREGEGRGWLVGRWNTGYAGIGTNHEGLEAGLDEEHEKLMISTMTNGKSE